MSGLLLMTLHIWGLSVLIFLLHYYSPRFGFAPLMIVVGGITVLTQNQFGVYVRPMSDFFLSVNSNVLIPVILLMILLFYVANGAVPARLIVFSILGINILTLLSLTMYRVYLSLPSGGSFRGFEPEVLLPPLNLRLTLGSLTAFLADMFVIAVFYQGVRNNLPKIPEWIVIGLALLAALWTDAFVFRILSNLGRADFAMLMAGDLLGKTFSALILWLPLAFYLTRIAPKLPGHIGSANRSTFDMLLGSFAEVKLELVRTVAALAKSEAERQKETEYLKLISGNVNEALWLANPHDKGHVFFINAAYERILGRSAASIYADPQPFFSSVYPEDRSRVEAEMPKQLEGNYDIEYRIIRPDGVIRWVRDRAFPVRDVMGAVYRIAGITEDITERQQFEKQKLELAVEREKVKLLRDFIGETSHDLKNPLTSMSLKIESLQRTKDPERQQQHFKDLERLVQRMVKMIDDLVTLARLENFNELEFMRLNINNIIEDICLGMRPIVEEKHMELKLELENGDVPMYASPKDLERALSNLIDNALHYTPENGTVSVQTSSTEKVLTIRISDSGMGIPETEQSNIFSRFYRATNVRSMTGTGLGLSIVKKVIDQHRGQIEVSSTVGKGTMFTIHLPIAT